MKYGLGKSCGRQITNLQKLNCLHHYGMVRENTNFHKFICDRFTWRRQSLIKRVISNELNYRELNIDCLRVESINFKETRLISRE